MNSESSPAELRTHNSKLFKHYKNKPYKFRGIAKHSETLEDMVIYETLYDNPNGRIWVRPKGMFFEMIELDGKTVPRFAELPLKILTWTELSETEIKLISPIIEETFGEWDPDWFFATFNNQKKLHLAVAYVDGKAAGFKLGYEKDKWEFYSWLGGVLPEFRNLGIASALMRVQHEWCKASGYKRVSTKTQNRFREMFLLNLKSGFNVIGTHTSHEGGLKILLEKEL